MERFSVVGILTLKADESRLVVTLVVVKEIDGVRVADVAIKEGNKCLRDGRASGGVTILTGGDSRCPSLEPADHAFFRWDRGSRAENRISTVSGVWEAQEGRTRGKGATKWIGSGTTSDCIAQCRGTTVAGGVQGEVGKSLFSASGGVSSG